MSHTPLTAGYIRLVDAAPLIVAQEMGFATEEGLDLTLRAAPSWSTLRDWLAFGQVEAAHLLSPVPIAMALGLRGNIEPIDVLQVLSVNGSVIGASKGLVAELRDRGAPLDFQDAAGIGQCLIGLNRALRVGVPFPFSMHAELLYYWLGSLGLAVPQALDVRTIPPPMMVDAMAAGEIDAFCVGEPWGSFAVTSDVAELLLPTSAIRAFAPEKVLAVRRSWSAESSEVCARLMRSVWRAGQWLANPANRTTVAELLRRSEYLAIPVEVIDRALSCHLLLSSTGPERPVPGFIEFFEGAATFPWKSQAAWIGGQLAARNGLDRDGAIKAAKAVFRTDLYRQNLAQTMAEMPGASEKLEGALQVPTPVASESGSLILQPDAFFDGRIFDPYSRV